MCTMVQSEKGKTLTEYKKLGSYPRVLIVTLRSDSYIRWFLKYKIKKVRYNRQSKCL